MRNVYIGTSGWQYGNWKGEFYPTDLPAKDQLSFYASKFNSVEINSTFYHLPRTTTCENWARQVPTSFKITLKLFRGITHHNKLRLNEECAEQIENFFMSAAGLEAKLGMILVQLPPSLRADAELLDTFLLECDKVARKIGNPVPLALEFRNSSWFADEIYQILDTHSAAVVINDSPGRWPSEKVSTAHRLYVRLHGNRELYKSPYDLEELRLWAKYVQASKAHETWIYFNNTISGAAYANAAEIQKLLT